MLIHVQILATHVNKGDPWYDWPAVLGRHQTGSPPDRRVRNIPHKGHTKDDWDLDLLLIALDLSPLPTGVYIYTKLNYKETVKKVAQQFTNIADISKSTLPGHLSCLPTLLYIAKIAIISISYWISRETFIYKIWKNAHHSPPFCCYFSINQHI